MYKSKKSHVFKIEPRTSRMESSHLIPFASSADTKWTKLKILSTSQLNLEVGDVRPAPDQPPPEPPPSHRWPEPRH